MLQLILGLALLIQNDQTDVITGKSWPVANPQSVPLAPVLETSGAVDKLWLGIKIDGVRGGLWELEDIVPSYYRVRMKGMKQREYCLISLHDGREACVVIHPNQESNIVVVYNRKLYLIRLFGREGFKLHGEK